MVNRTQIIFKIIRSIGLRHLHHRPMLLMAKLDLKGNELIGKEIHLILVYLMKVYTVLPTSLLLSAILDGLSPFLLLWNEFIYYLIQS